MPYFRATSLKVSTPKSYTYCSIIAFIGEQCPSWKCPDSKRDCAVYLTGVYVFFCCLLSGICKPAVVPVLQRQYPVSALYIYVFDH